MVVAGSQVGHDVFFSDWLNQCIFVWAVFKLLMVSAWNVAHFKPIVWHKFVQPQPSVCQVLFDAWHYRGVRILHWVGATRTRVYRLILPRFLGISNGENQPPTGWPDIIPHKLAPIHQLSHKVGAHIRRKPWFHWSEAAKTILDRMWWRQHRSMCIQRRSARRYRCIVVGCGTAGRWRPMYSRIATFNQPC